MSFYLFGYGFLHGDGDGFVGSSDFALSGGGFLVGQNATVAETASNATLHARFFFAFSFAATSATIVSGAVAERFLFKAYALYTAVITGFLYPIVAHWVWSNDGWASPFLLQGNRLFDSGAVDYAGALVVHVTGGLAALIACVVVGPRVGRFNAGIPMLLPMQSPVFQTAGTMFLWFGWYGFNCVAVGTLDGHGPLLAAKAAVSTTLAAAAGGGAVMVTDTYLLRIKAEPRRMNNGILCGLVAVSGCAGLIHPHNALGKCWPFPNPTTVCPYKTDTFFFTISDRRGGGVHLRQNVRRAFGVGHRRRGGRRAGALFRRRLGNPRERVVRERKRLRVALRVPCSWRQHTRELRGFHGVFFLGRNSRRQRHVAALHGRVDRRDVLRQSALDQKNPGRLVAGTSEPRAERHGRERARWPVLHRVPNHRVHVQNPGGGSTRWKCACARATPRSSPWRFRRSWYVLRVSQIPPNVFPYKTDTLYYLSQENSSSGSLNSTPGNSGHGSRRNSQRMPGKSSATQSDSRMVFQAEDLDSIPAALAARAGGVGNGSVSHVSGGGSHGDGGNVAYKAHSRGVTPPMPGSGGSIPGSPVHGSRHHALASADPGLNPNPNAPASFSLTVVDEASGSLGPSGRNSPAISITKDGEPFDPFDDAARR